MKDVGNDGGDDGMVQIRLGSDQAEAFISSVVIDYQPFVVTLIVC